MTGLLKGLFTFLVLAIASCGDTGLDAPNTSSALDVPQAVNEDPRPVLSQAEYEAKCLRTEYYFCPGVNGPLYRIKVIKDICKDPIEVIHISECEEFLECNPSNFHMGEEDCTTSNGLPGTKKIYCDKGYIKEGACETDCMEEVCDGLDNDCDGETDEDQLNACGECGIEPSEICDGIDNDCNGYIDEDLIRPCSTICEGGYETCIDGVWTACTAKEPQSEMCDGIDNDCDGAIDEGLDCLCTIQDIGTLFQCQEDPLLCGSGYKTCECKDKDCTSLGFTPCYAMCHWQDPPDPNCDPLGGKPLPYELCNNHDDNCNQLIDEDLFEICYTGPIETMNVGICQSGMMTCEKGSWGSYSDEGYFISGYCKGEVLPLAEDKCNGVDEDCDGDIDQNKEMQDTDILFIVDWSGSMGAEIEAVLIALNEFAKNYSDEEVIQWGLMVAPRTPGNFGQYNYLELVSDMASFEDFMYDFSSLDKNTMNGQFEMLYDALYLALMDLSSSEPWQLDELTWATMVSNAVKESVPELQNFKVSWRPNAKRVIIVFSDEHGQSYWIPKALVGGSWSTDIDGTTQDILLKMISTAADTSIYTFSTEGCKNSVMPYGATGWEPLALASGGKWFKLKHSPAEMYTNLMEIIEEEVCTE